MANQIQRLGSLILCAVSMVGSARAADLPVKAPPPAPVFNWTGCYVGGYVGGARSDGDMTFTDLGNHSFALTRAGSLQEELRTGIRGVPDRTAASSAAARSAVTGSQSAHRSCSASKAKPDT